MKKTKKISYAPLSGASVISDPDRHPHLVKLLDAIKQKGGKYMERRIQCAMDEYTKNFDPEKEWASQFKDLFFYRFNGDANKFWLLLERIAKKRSADFKSRDISCMNQLNLPENSNRAARADKYHCILKDRLFWDEIMMLKQNSDDLSGIKSAAKTIAKNVKNAFKNLSLPEITNNSGYEIDDIPETLADRKAMLERMLVPLIGTKKYCTGLRDFAEITGGSVPEICYHASKNKASTLAALCLLDVIAAAKYIPPPTPPHGSTQAKRHISEMYELRCKIKGLGVVKLTIGKRAYNSDMVYCITKFRFDKITKKRGFPKSA